MRIFSGIQPTGEKHLGNLIGGFRQYAATQEQGDAFFCIVDLHSITTDYDPADLHARTLDLYAMLDRDRARPGALDGLRAEPRHGARRGGLAALGRHELRPVGPHDAVQGQGRDRRSSSPPALFTYPVLMAGDILLYQADIVPIGDDQRQHLELARDIAERFNTRFGETFTVPRGRLPRGRARGSWTCRSRPRKMSTTGGTPQGTVGLLDAPDVDPEEVPLRRDRLGPRGAARADDKPGVSNLIDILSVASGRDAGGDRGAVRRRRLRAVQAGRRRGGRRAARADPGAVRASSGPTRASCCGCCALGADKARDGVDADARADVRGDGLRAAVRQHGDHRDRASSRSSSSPASSTTRTRRRSRSSSSRGPRSAASPGRSGSRPSRSARSSARP